jgi:hypothetical protein
VKVLLKRLEQYDLLVRLDIVKMKKEPLKLSRSLLWDRNLLLAIKQNDTDSLNNKGVALYDLGNYIQAIE